MRELKVGDLVIYTNKRVSSLWKSYYLKTIYRKIAKIVYIDKRKIYPYLLEFKKYINAHEEIGKHKGKKGHCKWCDKRDIKLAINHLKFKKWIKG